jgi:putrescine transport system substrate-binding protein
MRRPTAGGWCSIPRLAKRLAPCGIAFVDAPSEILAVALMSLGKDPYSSDPADLAAAEAALLAIRPYVRGQRSGIRQRKAR